MRSFFEIYDLIVLLIAALSESHGDDRERLNADLARLARTCKATRDPALDILWKTIMGFVPILELFPLEFHTNALNCTHLGPADWDHIRFYTVRIRSLLVNIYPVDYRGVKQMFIENSEHILPNLQHIDLGPSCELWLSIGAFVLPFLHSLTIQRRDDAAASIILRAFHSCRNLREVRVAFIRQTWGNSYAGIEKTFGDVVRNAGPIETLAFEFYTPQVVIDNVALLTHIQYLEISMDDAESLPLPPNERLDSTSSAFRLPFLRSIIIRGRSIKTLPTLTRYLTCPLEVMGVRITEASSIVPGDIGTWLRVLREVHLTTLKVLRIKVRNIDRVGRVIDHSYSRRIDWDFVSSISGLQLKELYVEGLAFDDKFLGGLAMTSRTLRVLSVTDLHYHSAFAPTFSGVLTVLRGLPELRSLTINFEEEKPPVVEGSPTFNLRVLDIDRSRIGSPVEMAEVLAKALRNLEKIFYAKEDSDPVHSDSRRIFREQLHANQRRSRADSEGKV